MSRFSLEDLADDTLLDGLHALVEHDHITTADLLAHIGEVARRRLFYPMGYPSMQAYCVKVLHLSEDAASKRVQVARKGWLFPQIFEAIADRRVHLSGMKLLVPFINEENVDDLIEAATHRSKRQIELLLAERFPGPEPEEKSEQVNVEDVNAPGHVQPRSVLKPVSAGHYLVQYGATENQQQRLEYALQLMSHRNPTGNLSVLHRAALELFIEQLEKEIFAATGSPREGEGWTSGRHIPASVRRPVWKRDGGQCTWVSPTGRRCESRWRIQFHHDEEFARGGEATEENVRLLCCGHNQYEADRSYGVEFMERKRSSAKGRRALDSESQGASCPRVTGPTHYTCPTS